MASTFSTALRLELMGTGDQTGTWGVTNNTNLGTLLEQSITGVLSVAQGDTTLTLSANNGASDQSRNAVINFTGAMTAGHNVIVPTSNKLYLIKNSTTGGFSITVKTSGGAGVAVVAGSSQWLYCDGTDVVQGLAGTLATQAASAVAITGGTIATTTLTTPTITGGTSSGAAISSATITGSTIAGYLLLTGGTLTGALTGTTLTLSTGAQTSALLHARNIGDSFEFGGTNPAGYGSTIGAEIGSGRSHIAFNAESGTTSNTYKTRGFKGSVFQGDLAGGFGFYSVANASADNQALTTLATLDSAGVFSATTVQQAGAQVATLSGTAQVVTGGARITSSSLGAISSGTVTLDPGNRPMQHYTNNGAHTLAPGSNGGSIILDIVNGASAGAITTSGWTKVVGTFTTTNTNAFRCSCTIGNNGSLLSIQALQ